MDLNGKVAHHKVYPYRWDEAPLICAHTHIICMCAIVLSLILDPISIWIQTEMFFQFDALETNKKLKIYINLEKH